MSNEKPLLDNPLLAWWAAWAMLLVLTMKIHASNESKLEFQEALAILTNTAGEVSIRVPGGLRHATAWPPQAMSAGTELKIAAGATATLVCKDGQILELRENTVLTSERCRNGKRKVVYERSAALIPDRGRVKIFGQSLTLEGRTRDDTKDYGLRPVLLSPRCPLEQATDLGCSRLARLPEKIRWVRVPQADRYLLDLTSSPEIEIAAGELECAPGGTAAPYQVCSLPWPETWNVEPGGKVFLQIEAKIGLFDSMSSEKTKLELLATPEAHAIEEELAPLAELDANTRNLLAATHYAERGLANEAILTLEKVALEHSGALLLISLGDLYQRVDLLYPAVLHYKKALAQLETADDPAVRVAAHVGLAWANHRWGSAALAVTHARTARDLCHEFALPEEDVLRLLAKLDGEDDLASGDPTRADHLIAEAMSLIPVPEQAETAATQLQQALRIYEQARQVQGQAEAHLLLGTLYGHRETYQPSREHFAQSAKLWRRLGRRIGAWMAIYGLAESSRFSGYSLEALAALDEARAVLDELNDPEVPVDLASLRLMAMRQGMPLTGLAELQAHMPQLRSMMLDNFSVMTSLSRADALMVQARYPEALAVLEEARPKTQGLMGVLEPKVLNGMGKIHMAQGDLDAARSDFEQARAKARSTFETVSRFFSLSGMELESGGDLRLDEVIAIQNLATLDMRKGEYAQALTIQREALSLLRSSENPPLKARIMAEMGIVHLHQGRYDQARERFERGLKTARIAGAQDAQAMILGHLATLQSLDYRDEEALRLQSEALTILQTMGHRAQEAQALFQMGGFYLNLRRLEEALKNFEQAREISREIGDPALEQIVLLRLSCVRFEIGTQMEVDRAHKLALRALELAVELDDPAARIETQLAIGWILLKKEAFDSAIVALKAARALSREHDLLPGEGNAELALGFYHSRYLGDHEAASDAFQRALKIFEASGSDTQIILGLAALGTSLRQQKHFEAAGKNWEAAAAKLEALQAEMRVPELQTSFNAFLPTSVHAALVDLHALQNRHTDAFLYAERSRSRTLLKSLGQGRIVLDAELDEGSLDQVRYWKAELSRLHNAQQVQQHEAGPEWSDPDALAKRQAEALEAYQRARLELSLQQPELAALVDVDASTLERVQSEVLDDATTLVAFYVLKDRVLAWVADRKRAQMVVLDIDQAKLAAKVEHLVDQLSSKDDDREVASFLYQRLIAPLEPHLRHRQLILIPHGVLHQLPFATLWKESTGRYLIEDFSLAYAPSASVLRFLKPKRSANEGALLALGNPTGDLDAAEEEVKTIAGLYGALPHLGAAATEARLRNARGIDIVHVAAHGEWNPREPELSSLRLAAGEGQDGHLEVHEIFNELDLRGVNLVVLAACKTMRGERTGGDEITGLTRAFLYAGSPSVITTAWNIDDHASRFLMEAFHRQLLAGETAAGALRAAQIVTLEQEGWNSPYYWAAFGLHGDWKAVEPSVVQELWQGGV